MKLRGCCVALEGRELPPSNSNHTDPNVYDQLVPPDTWFNQYIIIRVNDKTVAD